MTAMLDMYTYAWNLIEDSTNQRICDFYRNCSPVKWGNYCIFDE